MQEAIQNLGDVIRAARERRGMTQVYLAERAGVGNRTIMDIENHRGNPRFDNLYRIIQELNISADIIFNRVDTPIEVETEQFMRDFISCSDYEKRLIMSMAMHLLGELRKENREP